MNIPGIKYLITEQYYVGTYIFVLDMYYRYPINY